MRPRAAGANRAVGHGRADLPANGYCIVRASGGILAVSTILRLIAPLFFILALPLRAQTVSGVLVAQSADVPLDGYVIVLLDETGQQRGAALASESGRFTIRAPAAGRYRLQAERVGQRSVTSPVITLGAGQVLDYRFPVRFEPVRLAHVRSTAEGKCDITAQGGRETSPLWGKCGKR